MTTEATSQVNESDEDPSPASEDRYIRIDPDNLHGEVARLLQERPDFKQAVSTVVGTRAQREGQARIRELEAQLEGMTLHQKRQRFESMDEDERANALRDPAVAAEYADVMRRQAPNLEAVRAQTSVNDAVETALDGLRRIGAPDGRIQQWYAHLKSSPDFNRTSAATFVQQVQAAVDQEIHMPPEDRYRNYGYGKAPAAPKEESEQPDPSAPTAQANPRLARRAPDTSPADGGGARQRFKSQLDISQALMTATPEEKPALLAQLRDARARGLPTGY